MRGLRTLLLVDSEDDDEPRAAIELDVEGESESAGEGEGEGAHAHAQAASEYVVPATSDALMLSPTRAGFSRRRSSSRRTARSHAELVQDGLPNVYGRKLFATPDFWLLFFICSLCEYMCHLRRQQS